MSLPEREGQREQNLAETRSSQQQWTTTDNLVEMFDVLPREIRERLQELPRREELVEIILDLGRKPEARWADSWEYLSDTEVTKADLEYVLQHIGEFGSDNRAGIERTLHRISCIRNRQNEVVGLTCRIGRAVYGTIDILRDVIETGKSVLLLGRPGVGKTTMLREVARVLAGEFQRRVVVVDTSNEIAGDGDVPHPAIGRARRMQVPYGKEQASVMIEAVENHMPEVIVIDEIGTESEAQAARTIAERGVQLIATAHGNTLANLVMNPTLSDLVGGIQAVTLGDEEARKRGSQKTVLERKAPPTFDAVVEIQDKDTLAIHPDVAFTVDMWLRGVMPEPEVRQRTADGEYVVVQGAHEVPVLSDGDDDTNGILEPRASRHQDYVVDDPVGGHLVDTIDLGCDGPKVRIFPYAVSRNHLRRALQGLEDKIQIVNTLDEADLALTVKGQYRKMPKKLKEMHNHGLPVEVIRSNTFAQVQEFVRRLLHDRGSSAETEALVEAERAVHLVQLKNEPLVLRPQNAYIRRLQHQLIERAQLASTSVGEEPHRSVKVLPTSIADW
ncbi:MAG: AAA family ATPase [Firmicutes bacterium]|nr:AAA family ATPase [Bacillota bacterium]